MIYATKMMILYQKWRFYTDKTMFLYSTGSPPGGGRPGSRIEGEDCVLQMMDYILNIMDVILKLIGSY